jgi:hypothetical protein
VAEPLVPPIRVRLVDGDHDQLVLFRRVRAHDMHRSTFRRPTEYQHARLGSIVRILLNNGTPHRRFIHLLIEYRAELVADHLSAGVPRIQDAIAHEASTDPFRPFLVSYAILLVEPDQKRLRHDR